MNIKKLSALLLSALSVFSLAACSEEEPAKKEYVIDEIFNNMEFGNPELEGANLSSISLDTTNVKTKYYLGEEFSSEGLKVKTNYVKYVDGQPQSIELETENFYINTEEIDMTSVGKYSVEVVYRDGVVVKTSSYQIEVASSIFEDSGVKYLGGIEVKYNGQFSQDVLLNSDSAFDIKKVSATLHYFQNIDGVLVETTKPVAYTKIETENNIDLTKVGTYTIKYTYVGEPVVIDGVEYENKVSSYTIFNVVNPVTGMKKVSTGDTDLYASVDGLDYSKWQFEITREAGTPEIVNYSKDLFTIVGTNQYVLGAQTARVYLKEDMDQIIEVDVNVVESQTHNIKLLTDQTVYETVSTGVYKIGTGEVIINKPTATDLNRQQKDAFGSLIFPGRHTIKGADSTLQVTMDGPGIIVVYAASSGAGVRSLIMANSAGEDYEDLTKYFEGKQIIQELRFEVSEAGTYYFRSPESCYIHGVILAVGK